MIEPKRREIASEGDPPGLRMYSPQWQPLIQSLLATLADFEVEHQSELSKLKGSRMDARLKLELVGRLRARHQQRREPYLAELAKLERRIKKVLT